MTLRLQHPPHLSATHSRHWSSHMNQMLLIIGVALLQACSGGGSSSASSAGPTSINGTVTGFGSVMVDGVEVEDAYARIAHENADGTLSNDVLQMGQRVRLTHDGAGRASQVLIDAAVIGLASQIDTAANTLKVAGQTVIVNTNAANGPLTIFGGAYTNLSDVLANDLVQVHGTPVFDAGTSRYQVQATRIQRDSGVARVQVNGLIANYSATNGVARFDLNGLTVNTTVSTLIRPTESILANGLQITAYGSSLSANALTATHIRVNRNQDSGNTNSLAQLSGLVSNYSSAAGTFTLQGTTVRLGTVTAPANLANSAYVLVKGSVGADGSVTATSITVRTSDASSSLAQVQLIGPISDFVDNSNFMVRGVPVDAHNVTSFTNCFATPPLANDTEVRVRATQQANTAVVLATSVSCQTDSATRSIRSVEGTIASVDAANQGFTLTLSHRMVLPNSPTAVSSLSVQWNDSTTFSGTGLSAGSLAGKTVDVQGYFNGSILIARVVRLDDGSSNVQAMDGDGYRSKDGTGGTRPPGWQKYRNSH